MIAISVARNPAWDLHIHVSRHVVFHSVTLMGAGIYLMLMAVSGYFIRAYGGSWGAIIQVVFLCLAGALLVALLFSDRIRAQIRVLLSKHFFSFKYDYRQEWSEFTRNLAESGATVPIRIIGALGKLVHSNNGVLWLCDEDRIELFHLLELVQHAPDLLIDPVDHRRMDLHLVRLIGRLYVRQRLGDGAIRVHHVNELVALCE